MKLDDYEKLNPRCVVRCGDIDVTYVTPTLATKWRVDTLFEKEPVTLQWIADFAPGEILVDVGANVGMYTIWSARTRRTRVYAFEPESLNFALLNRNIVANGLEAQVIAYCAAISDRSGFGELHLSQFMAGGSCHSLDEKLDPFHRPSKPVYTQGCVSASLDDLVRAGRVPPPQYIKIDVDGFEPKVIRGAAETLRAGSVRSLLIEVNQNLPDHMAMVRDLNGLGFRHDAAQVARAERKSGPFTGCAEYVFKR
jgi:FkbM family methyltransferase